MQHHSELLPPLQHEWWLARRVFRGELCTIFVGLTDPPGRRERMRAAILARGLEATVAGRNRAGELQTFAECFRALYGEPLEEPP